MSIDSIPEPILKHYGDIREDFEQINAIVKEIDFTILKPIIQLWYRINKSFFDQYYKISTQQEILYGLE